MFSYNSVAKYPKTGHIIKTEDLKVSLSIEDSARDVIICLAFLKASISLSVLLSANFSKKHNNGTTSFVSYNILQAHIVKYKGW